MPSYKEKVIIEYFGDNTYHVYFQNAAKEKCGLNGLEIISEIVKWDDQNLDNEKKIRGD